MVNRIPKNELNRSGITIFIPQPPIRLCVSATLKLQKQFKEKCSNGVKFLRNEFLSIVEDDKKKKIKTIEQARILMQGEYEDEYLDIKEKLIEKWKKNVNQNLLKDYFKTVSEWSQRKMEEELNAV